MIMQENSLVPEEAGSQKENDNHRSGSSFFRSGLDRRSGDDRREAYHLECCFRERRKSKDRRYQAEKRTGWIRIGKWVSVCIGKDCCDALEESAQPNRNGNTYTRLGAPRLQKNIEAIIHGQLEKNEPPAVNRALERLLLQKYTHDDAVQLIGYIYALNVFKSIQENRLFSTSEYASRLESLPVASCR